MSRPDGWPMPAPYRAAEDLERFLGDPRDPASAVSFRQLVAHDERSELPGPTISRLNEWGLPRHLVPRADGGRLRSAEELFAILRSLARRDLTVTVGYGATLLAAIPVWRWGSDAQRRRVADLVGAGRFGALGLSEAAHGSDLLATELVAAADGDHFVLSGTKWPIGNATRGAFTVLLASTGQAGSPRGCSMFLLDKPRTEPDTWSHEPRVPTLGLRGGDISGITLNRCRLPAGALVGTRGTGLEIVLKTLQHTRTLLTALSIGTADTALRVTLDHVRRRRLYGKPVADIPIIREQLLSAYADLLVAECVALPIVRAITVAPHRLSLWSAVAKYLVPVIVNELLASLSEVMGARHFLREGVADGIFQKAVRDHAIVAVFDGTTHINLQVVASQLPSLLRGRPDRPANLPPTELFTLAGPAPDWDLRTGDVRLSNDGTDEISQAWPLIAARTEKLCANTATAFHEALRTTVQQLDVQYQAHLNAVASSLREQRSLHSSAVGFAHARTHCLLHAASACLQTWLANPDHPDEFHQRGEWLLLCLRRLLTRMRPDRYPTLPDEHTTGVERRLLQCADDHRLFSLIPIPLGNRP